jgi:transmembrane sensor
VNLESPLAQDTEAEAAAWWLRLQKDESAGFSAEFQEWIAIPSNDREFEAIALAMETLDEFGTSPVIDEMRQSARNWFDNGGVVRRSYWKVAFALAAALLISIGISAYYLRSAGRTMSYQTALGERRAVTLEDGSRVLLDSNSEVDVRYSKVARATVLTRGHARFDVAHDTVRPFSVTATGETVVAVGTSFDVELRGSKVLVTLIQGHVLIKNASDRSTRYEQSAAPIKLSAGQQVMISADHATAIAPADFSVTQAWEAGHLVFRGERLADAVEQINRYSDRLIIVDPSAASFRVSGMFNVGDTKSFLSAATEFYPIEAVSDVNGTIRLRRIP